MTPALGVTGCAPQRLHSAVILQGSLGQQAKLHRITRDSQSEVTSDLQPLGPRGCVSIWARGHPCLLPICAQSQQV